MLTSKTRYPTQSSATMIGQPPVAVVMVPLAAQGHLNQLLHLSRLIAAYNIPVHYVATTTHTRQAQVRLHGWDPTQLANIHFHSFTIPPFPSPPPDPTAANKFPAHLIPSFQAACHHLRHPVTELLRLLSSNARRVIVIHDSLMATSVDGVDSIPNAESYNFHSVSAFTMALYGLEQAGKIESNDGFILKDLKIPSLEGCFTPEFWDFVGLQFRIPKKYSGNLYNTCRAIERPYLELLQNMEHEIRHWAVGPFNPVKIAEREHSCLEWLGRQEPNSVIYVSFGTTTTMRDEQIREIADGLARSKQKFIWVLRDADRGDVFDRDVRKFELSETFEKTTVARGVVVRDWAPQLEILSHQSTGGFMTHCGWNSCMESLAMGVPVAAWPMHSDQPRNAMLMTEVLRVGILVRDWSHRDEMVTSATVEDTVRRLMASEEGCEMRKRVKKLGDVVQRSVNNDGESRVELDSFIAHITR